MIKNILDANTDFQNDESSSSAKSLDEQPSFEQKKDKERRERAIADFVTNDFIARRKERQKLERQWELNMNFLNGKQYCELNSRGEITDETIPFFWQNREVFNHIAPLMDSRLARFSHVRPVLAVRPKSDDDSFVTGAKTAERLISSAIETINLHGIVEKVTTWSETCGTGFYKVIWDSQKGTEVAVCDGKTLKLGDVNVIAVSPFEIFPDNIYAEGFDDCFSVIQAKAVPVREIKKRYNVQVDPENIDVLSLNGNGYSGSGTTCVGGVNNSVSTSGCRNVITNASIVIERYEKASENYPNGRLTIVAGNKLLFEGELPFVNQNGERIFPFVKQESNKVAGSFFGASVIERLIPVQRAFNAVKNRKHEFLNRLSMGIMTVEDGSVDVDDLREEGLQPGKVLVYRQGAEAPKMMDEISMPNDFDSEEEKLINEFVVISGVADVSSSSTNSRLSSGSALQLLIQQDNERLVMPAERIRNAYVQIAKKILSLYAQFSGGIKAVRFRDGSGRTKVIYADKLAFCSNEVYLENENELIYTASAKKENVFKLYESGLLADESGSLRPATKEKVLSLLGYKDLDYQKGVARLHEEKASEENDVIRKSGLCIEEVDDDNIHVEEHVRYILSEYNELKDDEKTRLYEHLKLHKDRINSKKTEFTAKEIDL